VATADLWSWREDAWSGTDLVGFEVEAADGSIGKVVEATYDAESSFAVVDTGPWIFGSKVLLPAGVIDDIDVDDGKVFVSRMKDEIKNGPEFDEATYRDEGYRNEVERYYSTARAPGAIRDEPVP
jgi:PRC-barrel domain